MKSGLWAVSLGWELAVPIGAGAVLGHYLDLRYHTGHAVTLVLLFLGVIAGYCNVVRLVRRVIARDRYQAQREEDGVP